MSDTWEDIGGTLVDFEGEMVDATIYGTEDDATYTFVVAPDELVPAEYSVDEFITLYDDIREAEVVVFSVDTIVDGLYNYKLAQMLNRKIPSFRTTRMGQKATQLNPLNEWSDCYDFDTSDIEKFFEELPLEYKRDFGGKLPPYYELVSQDELAEVIDAGVSSSIDDYSSDISDLDTDEIEAMEYFIADKVFKRAKAYIEQNYSTQMWFKF